jgi:Uma2 family endonuclease
VPQPARRPATYDDLLALPENVVGEIISGEVSVSPRPGGPHGFAAHKLGASLDGPFDDGDGGPGGWIFIPERELHLEADVVVPDLAGWRRSRLPGPPADAFFTIAPDWVCEVLSPGTTRVDRVKKAPIYAYNHVAHLWFLDPLARTLEVMRNEAGYWKVILSASGDDEVRAEPFDAITLKLSRLWWG